MSGKDRSATTVLAPYAISSEDPAAINRTWPQSLHPYRNPFQRDRDRVLHARAFRRLAGKTQVFTRRHSDHIRSRLTHTLEVTQIARTVAAMLGLNGDLVETLALVHDIGHPPFGHAGERALHEQLVPHGLTFDHNLHALRIVEHFELRYPDFRGLNLTHAVREGIIKHSRDYTAAQHPELAEYLLDEFPPLEAQLIDLADEIAYLTADLDDGIESGLIHRDDALHNIPQVASYFRIAEQQHPGAWPRLVMNEAVKTWLNRLVDDLITNTAGALKAANIQTVSGIRRQPNRIAAFSAPVEEERRGAKQFLQRSLYNNVELNPEKNHATHVIGSLFTWWMQNPGQLPEHQQQLAESSGLPRAIADYIAGMTDDYILKLYEEHQR